MYTSPGSFPQLTTEVLFDVEEGHTESEHRQFVEAVSDLLCEGQKCVELVQLNVQTVSVTL